MITQAIFVLQLTITITPYPYSLFLIEGVLNEEVQCG